MNDMKKVTIYTDGFCLDNPGRGGYGAVLLYGEHRKEIFGGFRLTTNNRMEIVAAIHALQALKMRCTVTLYSDSKYLVDSMMQGWVKRWQANGWKRKTQQIKNVDLWVQLLDLCEQHDVEFIWVQGHAGNPENERADALSEKGAKLPEHTLAIDENYENRGIAVSPVSITKSSQGEAKPLMSNISRGIQVESTTEEELSPITQQRHLPVEPDFLTSATYTHPLSGQKTSLTDLQTAILACVTSFPGQLTRTTVAQILVTSRAGRVEIYRDYCLYGKFEHLSRSDVVQHVDYLIVLGLIAQQGKALLPGKKL